MRPHSTRLSLLTLVLAGLLSGCLHARSLEPLRQEFQRSAPGLEYKKTFKLTLGPISLFLLRTIARLVPEDEVRQARLYASKIRKVEVAIYETESAPEQVTLRTPRKMARLLNRKGWEQAVRVREDDAHVWVLYKEDTRGQLRDLYVVTAGADELVLVRVKGRLDQTAALVLRDQGISMKDLLGFGKHDSVESHPSDEPDGTELPSQPVALMDLAMLAC